MFREQDSPQESELQLCKKKEEEEKIVTFPNEIYEPVDLPKPNLNLYAGDGAEETVNHSSM